MPEPGRGDRLRRIVDRPEHHEAPGAYAWDRRARRRRDDAASSAAQRFLQRPATGDEECWRCEVAAAAGSLGLCQACLDDLRAP